MSPLRVCVIGGGPGAMFFCHAWNQQRSSSSSLHELEITCFEMQSVPGGVWRSTSKEDETHHAPIYEELWTNGVSPTIEFHDYTFDEHFEGQPVTAYFPRRDVYEYLVGRVTKNHPTFFQDYFVFDTKVMSVQEASNDEGLFKVTVQHMITGEESIHFFDRCLWAAGENCKASIPESLLQLFHHGPTTAMGSQDFYHYHDKETKEADEDQMTICLLHSSETQRIRDKCKGGKILLIGGAFSAEDLALQCLKWGAKHVDVACRNDDAEVTWMSHWPANKVKIHEEMALDSIKDGKIILKVVETIWPRGYRKAENYDDEGVVLEGIQTVIFCTGYRANLDMIDLALRPESGMIPSNAMGAHPSLFVTDYDWSNWKMKTDNQAHKLIGDVPAGQKRMIRANSNHPDMHRGILFKNPNMMYLSEHGADTPLVSLDVRAWLLCSYLTGLTPMPSVDELKKANMEEFLDQMHLPTCRYYFDEAYFEILIKTEAYWEIDSTLDDYPCDVDNHEYLKYGLRMLNRIMEEGKYPGASYGTYEKLNKTGRRIIEFMYTAYEMRADLASDYPEDLEWRTFRDADEAELLFSIYTGTKTRRLRKPWMNIVAKEGAVSLRNGDI